MRSVRGRFESVSGPDPEEPDRVFRDGDHYCEVQIVPARFPIAGTRGNPTAWDAGTTAVLVGYLLVANFASRLLDRRWKMVVSRIDARRGSFWRIVHVEFFSSMESAKIRQVEFLEDWKPGQFADADLLKRTDIKRIRQSSCGDPALRT